MHGNGFGHSTNRVIRSVVDVVQLNEKFFFKYEALTKRFIATWSSPDKSREERSIMFNKYYERYALKKSLYLRLVSSEKRPIVQL